jgi:hypothetical protein
MSFETDQTPVQPILEAVHLADMLQLERCDRGQYRMRRLGVTGRLTSPLRGIEGFKIWVWIRR